MGTGEVKEREALVQLTDFGAVVVGQEELALDVLQRIPKPDQGSHSVDNHNMVNDPF